MLSGLSHESGENSKYVGECLDAFFGMGCGEFRKCVAFIRIRLNSSFC